MSLGLPINHLRNIDTFSLRVGLCLMGKTEVFDENHTFPVRILCLHDASENDICTN
jgi:hypothetical protein